MTNETNKILTPNVKLWIVKILESNLYYSDYYDYQVEYIPKDKIGTITSDIMRLVNQRIKNENQKSN